MAAGIAREVRHDHEVDLLDEAAAGRPFTAASAHRLVQRDDEALPSRRSGPRRRQDAPWRQELIST